MNVLLDECTPASWAPFLSAHGHPARRWTAIGQQGDPDVAVIAWAAANETAVLTCDDDLGQLLWQSGDSVPSVIQLGSPSWLPETHGAIVLAACAECEDRQPRCHFVRIAAAGNRFKMVPLPMRPDG